MEVVRFKQAKWKRIFGVPDGVVRKMPGMRAKKKGPDLA
jgi:hypothetical protein